jgi:hemerythrin-like domain-containing protein
MKATDFLRKQHREVESLLKEVLHSHSSRERRELVREIGVRLDLHTKLEEELFYPAFRAAAGNPKAEEMVLEAYEEHHVVDLVIRDIATVQDVSTPSFDAKMTVLKELIEHHVEGEETEMFPSAEKKLGAERLRALGERMREEAEHTGDGAA